MKFTEQLTFKYSGENFTFRSLVPADVSSAYIDGLRLENKYLSHIPENLTIQTQQQYVSQIIESDSATICGIFIEKNLIGTAGLQNLIENEYAAVGIFLFSTLARGKGYGKVMVWAASRIALHHIKLAGTMGGMKPDNIASLRSFLACGGISTFDSEREINQVHISATNLETLPGLSDIRVLVSS
jgi:RimJ/RimL family protein N-acetyltransferase